MLAPLLAVIPLQLLAYYIARERGPERRPAAEPREDGDGRVTGVGDVGIDLLEIERLERALERRPRLAERLFTEASGPTRPRGRVPASTWRPRFCAKEAVAKALGSRRGTGATSRSSAATVRHRYGSHGAAAERAAALGVEVQRIADAHAARCRRGRDRGAARCDDASRLARAAPRRRSSSARSTRGRSSELGIPGARADGARRRRPRRSRRRARARQARSRSCAARATTAATGSSCARAAARARARRRACCCSARPDELQGDARANFERLPGAPPEPFDADRARRARRRSSTRSSGPGSAASRASRR